MEPIEIFGAIVGITALASLIVCMFIGIRSCEKTEEHKRELMKEVTAYYKHRNSMFEEERKNK